MTKSQLLRFQINPLSQLPLSINSLHSHLHLSLFYFRLLLQTFAFNVHLHLQVPCHPIYLVSLVLEIILNTLAFAFNILAFNILQPDNMIAETNIWLTNPNIS